MDSPLKEPIHSIQLFTVEMKSYVQVLPSVLKRSITALLIHNNKVFSIIISHPHVKLMQRLSLLPRKKEALFLTQLELTVLNIDLPTVSLKMVELSTLSTIREV